MKYHKGKSQAYTYKYLKAFSLISKSATKRLQEGYRDCIAPLTPIPNAFPDANHQSPKADERSSFNALGTDSFVCPPFLAAQLEVQIMALVAKACQPTFPNNAQSNEAGVRRE